MAGFNDGFEEDTVDIFDGLEQESLNDIQPRGATSTKTAAVLAAMNIEDAQRAYEDARESTHILDKTVSQRVDDQAAVDADMLVDQVSKGIISPDEAIILGKQYGEESASKAPANHLYDQVQSEDKPSISRQEHLDSGVDVTGFTQTLSTKELVNKRLSGLIMDTDNLDLFTQGVEQVIPAFAVWTTREAIVKGFAEVDPRFADNVSWLTGNAFNELSEKMNSLTVEDKAKVVNGVFDYLSTDDSSVLSNSNAYAAFAISSHLTGARLSEGETWFENSFAVLDLIAAPLAVGSVVKEAKRALTVMSRDSILRRATGTDAANVLAEGNPKGAASIKSEHLQVGEDTKELANGGVTKDDIGIELMPQDPPTTVHANPSRIALVDEVNTNNAEAIITEAEIRGQYTTAERNIVLSDKLEQTTREEGVKYRIVNYKIVDEDGNVNHIDKSIKVAANSDVLKNTDEGIVLQATYGKPDSARGFESITNAMRVATHSLKLPHGTFKLMSREKGTGKMYQVKGEPKDYLSPDETQVTVIGDDGADKVLNDPDIYIDMDWTYKYNKNDLSSFDGAPVVRGIGWTTHLVTAAHKISHDIGNLVQVAHDKEQLVRAKLGGAEMNRAVNKLSKDENMMLGRILLDNKGTSRNPGRRMTDVEMEATYDATPKTIAAYNKVRDVNETLFTIENHNQRKKLVAKGAMFLRIDGEDIPMGVIPFKQAEYEDASALVGKLLTESNGGVVFDVVKKELVEIDSVDKMQDLLNQGYLLAKTDGKLGIRLADGDSYTTILINPVKAKLTELPDVVLRYNPGYIHAQHSNTHYARVPLHFNVDGKPSGTSRTIAAGDSIGDAHTNAKAYIREQEEAFLTAGGRIEDMKPIKYEVTLPDEVDEFESGFSKGYNDGGAYEQKDSILGSTMEDPITSTHMAISAASRGITYDRILSQMNERFLNTYGQHLNKEGDIHSGWATDFEEVGAANEFLRYMEMMKGVQDPIDKAIQLRFRKVADMVETSGHPSIAKAIRAGRDTTPAATAKGLAFTTLIGVNAMRHAVMQASQYLFLGAIDPIAAAKGGKLGMLLVAGHGTKDSNPAAYAGILKAAQALGHSKEEFTTILNNYRSSGIPYSVDANMFMTEGFLNATAAIANTTGQYHRRKVANALQSIPAGLQKVGFNFGELTNLTTTYAFTHVRAIDKHGSKAMFDKDLLQETAADAKRLALSPNKPGSYRWQHGALSFATQFAAFPLKALELVTMGGKTLSKEERARLVFGQSIMYGTTGLGIREGYLQLRDELGYEVPESLDVLIQGGMIDAGISGIFNIGISDPDDQTRFAIASSMSPLVKADAVIKNVHDFFAYGYDPKLLGTAFGPAGAVIGNIMGAMNTSYKVFTEYNLDTDEQALKVMATWAEVVPLLSNINKTFVGWNASQKVSSTNYGATVNATHAELMANGLFGVKSYAEEDHYRTIQSEGHWNKIKKGLANDMAKIYNVLVRRMENPTPEMLEEAAIKASSVGINLSYSKRQELMTLAKPAMLDRGSPGYTNSIRILTEALTMEDDISTLRTLNAKVQNAKDIVQSEKDGYAEATERAIKRRELEQQGEQ